MSFPIPDVLRTDLELARIRGVVEEHEDCIVVRTPHNPDFYFGNFLLLPGPPEDLDAWTRRFEEVFGVDTAHRALLWGGADIAPEVAARARELGYGPDLGTGLGMDAPPPAVPAPALDWSVRPLEVGELDAFEQLNVACDAHEAVGTDSYRRFKSRIRETIRYWVEEGHAVWWGAFDGTRHIAQCGFATFGDLGRFQAVETHPDYRRRGVCSALIATVARHGFESLGCRRVLLEADTTGPAMQLYRRLGFRRDHEVHSLVRPSDPRQIVPETVGHHPDIRSLTTAAFEGPGEAALIEQLRDKEGAISLVAVQSGGVMGHILFTPVTVGEGEDAWRAMALGPMAVRPNLQRRGVGSALVEAGLAACREAGHEVCFVLGHPAFYPRFGFEPAAPKGLTCAWPVPEDVFMVTELVPGVLAGRSGRVAYDPAFDAV